MIKIPKCKIGQILNARQVGNFVIPAIGIVPNALEFLHALDLE